MKMNIHLKKQLIRRVCALLIATVSIGLVYNVINPSGIPLRKVLNVSVVTEKAIPNLTTSVYGHEMLSVSIIKADNESTIKRPIVSSENSLAIPWEKAKKLIEEDKAIFIDLRSDSEYQARHFPGAVSIPVSSIKDGMVTFKEKHSTDKSLLIGCITQDCMSAIKATSTFVKANYSKVRVVYGDGTEWGADLVSSLSSLPKTHKRNVRGSYSNETISASIIPVNRRGYIKNSANYNTAQITWREVKQLLEKEAIVLADGRSRQAFEAGHIPGAVSLPLATLAEEIGSFMNKFPAGTPIVVYCGNRRCAIAQKLSRFLVNHYGYSDVSVMPGGYLEWRQAEL